jgi:hypothetical protein
MVSDFFALEHHVLIKSATDLFLDNECAAHRPRCSLAGLGIARTRTGEGAADRQPRRLVVLLSSQLVQRTRHCR